MVTSGRIVHKICLGHLLRAGGQLERWSKFARRAVLRLLRETKLGKILAILMWHEYSHASHTSQITTTAESTTNTEMVKTVQQEKNRPLRWSKLVSACQFIEQGTHAGCGIGQVWRQDKSQNHLWVNSVKFSGHLWHKLGTVVEIIKLNWSFSSMSYLKKGLC